MAAGPLDPVVLDDGKTLRVPVRVEGSGVVGLATKDLHPGDEGYDEWWAFLTKDD